MAQKITSSLSIASHAWPVGGIPVVSIFCLTYNHANFIRQCLDGFLIQKTSFPFEIVVHDDASTDGTTDIIREYTTAFPDHLTHVLQTINQWPDTTAIFQAIKDCRGEYVAICDGDDYWTDPYKLQKQVDLLEANPHASGCFHSADDLVEDTGVITKGHWHPPDKKPFYTLDDLLPRLTFAPTASLVLRRESVLKVPKWAKDVPHGDFGLLAVALMDGPLLYIDEPMSVYRRHSGAIHSTTYGSVADFRALKSIVHVGHTLGLQNRDSYLEGIRWRLEKLEASIHRDQDALRARAAELEQTRSTYDRARQSKFFRLGVNIDRLRRKLLGRRQ